LGFIYIPVVYAHNYSSFSAAGTAKRGQGRPVTDFDLIFCPEICHFSTAARAKVPSGLGRARVCNHLINCTRIFCKQFSRTAAQSRNQAKKGL